MNASQKAFELRSKLFALVNEFRTLHASIQAPNPDDSTQFDNWYDARCDVDTAAAELAQVYERLGDLFIDAARDQPEYPFPLG